MALFGTLGVKDSRNYYEQIKRTVEEIILSANKILGHFLCQGKINEKLTDRHKKMLKMNPNDEHVKEQLKNHKQSSSNPDNKDMKNAKEFVKNLREMF